MLVPKLVCEVSYASGFVWFASVCCSLGCEEHDERALPKYVCCLGYALLKKRILFFIIPITRLAREKHH